MEPSRLALERLRDPKRGAVEALASLLVEEALSTPLREVAHPRWMASQLAATLEAATGEGTRAWMRERMAAERARWSQDRRSLRRWLPAELEPSLRKVVGRPWSPDPDMVLRIIDQAVVRDLVADILTDSLTRFSKRLRSLDKSVLGGIGGAAARKAVQRGRGLFGQMVGDIAPGAEGLMGAMAEEFEASLHRRVTEFVGRSVQDTLGRIARHLADPSHAEAYGEVRLAVLDVLLDTPIAELTAEADKLDPEELVGMILDSVRGFVTSPDFLDTAEARIAALMEQVGDGTLGAWLDEVGLREVWQSSSVELLGERLGAVVRTEAFERWWGELFEA
ncbi:MAG: hypothetical protein JXX28_02930 [Deltaproteobacteria bacterium]|nr:hypothetical protein [Deltaproteobacteria bacterium]